MRKVKNFVKKHIKKDCLIYKGIRKTYHKLSTLKYKIINQKEIRKEHQKFHRRVDEAIIQLDKYNNSDYVVFYNPTWLGVAASTIGLFKNYIPLEHVYKSNDIRRLAETIKQKNIKSVIFSQVCDGWTSIINELKLIDEKIIIKVIWHGNCYEFFSDFTWNLNKEVMKLYKENKIDSFAFVRSTMYEFYKKCGFKSYYLQNNVNKENAGKTAIVNNKNVKIGIYNADSRELKNIYTAMSAMRLVPHAIADIVPINSGAKKFAEILGLEISYLDCYIPNEDLMKRIQKNDINIYPTFTENAPMFPLESFEMGVPCLIGNNNDYFVDTELGNYVILTKEDDAEYIKERIIYVLENREKVMKLYREWKEKFDVKCEQLVKEFIKI